MNGSLVPVRFVEVEQLLSNTTHNVDDLQSHVEAVSTTVASLPARADPSTLDLTVLGGVEVQYFLSLTATTLGTPFHTPSFPPWSVLCQ